MKQINSRSVLIFLLFTSLLFIYSLILFNRPILSYDDPLLISPLYELTSIADYFMFVKTGKIFDFLPVRDFFYYFDIRLSSFFNWYSFQLGNFFLWLITLFTLFSISRIFLNESHSFALVFLIGCSPLSVSSVAWISAKKHLLSLVFMLFLLRLYLRPPVFFRKSFVFSFSLSFLVLLISFSHPINLPVVFLIFIYEWIFLRFNRWRLLIAPFLTMLFSLGIHFYYYRYVFSSLNSGISKTTLNLFDNLDLKFLSLGRYFYLSFFQFDSLPTPRYPGSWQNVFGLCLFFLLSLVVYFFYKKKHPNRLLLLFFFTGILLSLSLPIVQVANVFVSDTYFLTGQLFFFLFMIVLIKDYLPPFFKVFFQVYIFVLVIFSFNYSKVFLDTKTLFTYAVAHEPTPDSIVNLVRSKHSNGDFSDTNQLLIRVWKWNPGQVDLLATSINDVFLNPAIHSDKKIELISSMKPLRSLNYFYLSILYSNKKDFAALTRTLPLIFSNIPDFILSFTSSRNSFFGAYYALCELNPQVVCQKHSDNFIKELKKIDLEPAKVDYYRTLFTKNGKVDYNPYW